MAPKPGHIRPNVHQRYPHAVVDDDVAYPAGGISVCCCRVCTCINLGAITSHAGLLKCAEVLLGSLCQTLLLRFGQPYAADIGQAYTGFLQTVASSLTVSTVLLACYVLSGRTHQAVRQSLFVSETPVVGWVAFER